MAQFNQGPSGVMFQGGGRAQMTERFRGMGMRGGGGRPWPPRVEAYQPWFGPGPIPPSPFAHAGNTPFACVRGPFPPVRGPYHRNVRPNFDLSKHQHRTWQSHKQSQQENSNHKKKNKKQGIDKRDLAENNLFYCDICDRGFKTKEKHEEHLSNHEKCKVEGCSYTAAPKLVQLHYNLQHKTGLAKKIWQLESPGDLAKWREERRKNFPTAANIAKKKAAQAEKIARGEVLENKFLGKFNNNKFARGRGRGRGRGHWKYENGTSRAQDSQFNDSVRKRSHDHPGNNEDKTLSSPKKPKPELSEKPSEEQRMPVGDPLSFILPDGSDGSEEELDKRGQISKTSQRQDMSRNSELTVAGSLSSLISSYATDSETEDTDEVRTNQRQRDHISRNVISDSGGMVREERSTFNRKRQKRKRGKKGSRVENTIQPRKSTLLEKLLAPQIRHERNVILQCVRYIVKNRFFSVEKKTTKESPQQGGQLCSNSVSKFDDEIWENGL